MIGRDKCKHKACLHNVSPDRNGDWLRVNRPKEDGYLGKTPQKLLVFGRFGGYGVVLWHEDCLAYSFAHGMLGFS